MSTTIQFDYNLDKFGEVTTHGEYTHPDVIKIFETLLAPISKMAKERPFSEEDLFTFNAALEELARVSQTGVTFDGSNTFTIFPGVPGLEREIILEPPSDNNMGKTFYFTLGMTRGFGDLLKSLLGPTIEYKLFADPNNPTQSELIANTAALAGWKVPDDPTDPTTPEFELLVETLLDFLDSSQVKNTTLQSMIEAEYVRAGNEMINAKLQSLEEAITVTKDVLTVLEEIQALKNKLEPEIKGTIDPSSISATDSFWSVGPTGTSRVDKFSLTFDDDFGTPIAAVADIGIPGVSITNEKITALLADMRTGLTNDLAYSASNSGIPGISSLFDPPAISLSGFLGLNTGWSGDGTTFPTRTTSISDPARSSLLSPQFIRKLVTPGTSPGAGEELFLDPFSINIPQLNSTNHFLVKESEFTKTLMDFLSDNGFDALTDEETIDLLDQLFDPPLSFGEGTSLASINNQTQEIANRLAILVRIAQATPSDEDIAEFNNFQILLTQYIQTLEDLDTTVEEEGEGALQLAESNNRLFKKLEEIKDKLPPALPDGVTNLDQLPLFEQIIFKKKLVEWIEDQYGIEGAKSAQQGNNQKLLTEAITLGENLNDTNKTELKRFMFVFEEFYKSASVMLSTINRLIEKIASAIAR